MLRRHVICVYLCVLAAWMQFLTPVAALSMERSSESLGVICGRGAVDKEKGTPPIHRHHGDCCLACHADLGAAPLGEQPTFVAFDYPIASPLRWLGAGTRVLLFVPRRQSLPRGPPALA